MSGIVNRSIGLFILLFVNTLKNFGFLAIIYYASVISIGKDYYEAAELDGAGKMKQIWYITLPFLKPTIIMMVLLAVGKVFYSDFGLFYQVPQNSGALFSVTNTIDTYVYRSLIQLVMWEWHQQQEYINQLLDLFWCF